MKPISEAARRALQRAADRERGNVCPMPLHAAAQMALLHALLRHGFITDTKAPYITDAGRAYLLENEAT